MLFLGLIFYRKRNTRYKEALVKVQPASQNEAMLLFNQPRIPNVIVHARLIQMMWPSMEAQEAQNFPSGLHDGTVGAT